MSQWVELKAARGIDLKAHPDGAGNRGWCRSLQGKKLKSCISKNCESSHLATSEPLPLQHSTEHHALCC